MVDRALCAFEVVDLSGNIQRNTQVTLYETDATTLLAATLYRANTGSTTWSNPMTTDSRGRIVFYLTNGQRLLARVNGVDNVVNAEPDPANYIVAPILMSQITAPAANTVLVSNGSTISGAALTNAYVDAAAGIVASKLAAGGTANRVVATSDGTNMAMQQVLTAMLETNAVTQVAFTAGSTSDPTTTSGSYVDLTDMTTNMTTKGGAVLGIFVTTAYNATAGDWVAFAFNKDAAGQEGSQRFAAPVSNYYMPTTLLYYWSSVTGSAASPVAHQWKVQWATSSGHTATAFGANRYTLLLEIKR